MEMGSVILNLIWIKGALMSQKPIETEFGKENFTIGNEDRVNWIGSGL
jgi:hypothetical protein